MHSHKKSVLISAVVAPVVLMLFAVNFASLVKASFGSWGDSSLINACVDSRGKPTVVSPGTSCNADETQATWLKDIDAGTGLTISRSSSGATLGLVDDTSSGWVTANETWTYASATTITVPSDATTKYSPGDKIRLKQGGGYKYFYVVGVTSTILTVTGGSDYSVANATITDNYYSKATTPVGFPQYFNWSPTYLTNYGAVYLTSVTTNEAKFAIISRTVHVLLDAQGTASGSASGGGFLTATPPVTPADSFGHLTVGGADMYVKGVGGGMFWTIGQVHTENGYLLFETSGHDLIYPGTADIGTSYMYEF